MLYYIALLCPAVISVLILQHRNDRYKLASLNTLVVYIVNLIINIFLSSLTVCILLGADVRTDSFVSLSFFTKYIIIAVVFAVGIPYVWCVIKMYIKVDLVIENYEKDKE